MKSPIAKYHLPLPRGYAHPEAASFVAQLDDLSRRLWKDLAGVSAAELAWQPKRGTNTMGMLLAHMAIVEVFWMQRVTTGVDDAESRRVLGLGMDDDGMPLPPGGLPPRTLRGWSLDRFRALEARARAFTKRRARTLTASDLDRVFRADRPGGQRRSFGVRWSLYHVVEHTAGHYGQVLLLRHLHRDRRRAR